MNDSSGPRRGAEVMADLDCRIKAAKIARKLAKTKQRESALLILEYTRQMLDGYLMYPTDTADET